MKDYKGKRFGRLTVIEFDEKELKILVKKERYIIVTIGNVNAIVVMKNRFY